MQQIAVSGLFAWQLVTPLSRRRMGPAAATLRIDDHDHVIVTGGYNGDVDENVLALHMRMFVCVLSQSKPGLQL
jgi:hypothetical protein